MNFDLHKPCATCPFRTDCLPGWLGHKRANEVAEGLNGGNTFQCHCTLGAAPQPCAGALIVLRADQGGFSGALSVACAMGWLDYNALDAEAPVFASLEAFIEHHAGGQMK